MKKFIRCIIFLIIFCFMWTIVFKVLWLGKTDVGYFYEEPKNSLDVVYTGASNALAHYNTVLAFNLYGFTTGMLSTNGQPFSATKYLMQEAEKYQNPKLYVIDIARVGNGYQDTQGSKKRDVIDSLKNSKNRIDAINGMLKYTDVKKEDYINYYFSFLLYHNKWKTPTKTNIIGDKNSYKGYLFNEETSSVEEQDIYQWDNEEAEMDKYSREILEDLINYIKSNRLKVLFIVPVRKYEEEEYGYINNATSIIQENGYEVINFNKLDDFSVDYSKDFYNFAHINVWGATKYTKYFSEYLKEHYNLPDHRGNKKYNSWESEYKRFKENYKKRIGQNFEDLL